MPKCFRATDELAVEATRDIRGKERCLVPGTAGERGQLRLYLTVWEPGDTAHPSLPTLRQFLDHYTDQATGILTYDWQGQRLAMDAAPLRDLPVRYSECRVSPGVSFVTHEALELARTAGRR